MNIFNFRNWSIKNKILAVCIFCIVLPMTVTTIFSYNKSNRIIMSEVSGYSNQILTQLKNNIEGNIKDIERLSLLPYSNQQVINILEKPMDNNEMQLLKDRNAVMNFIIGVRNVRYDFSGLYIYSEKNENHAWNEKSLDISFNFKDTDWYKALSSKSKEWVVLGPHIPDGKFSPDDMVFSVVRPIKDTNSEEILGYFILDVKFTTISENCDKAKIGKDGEILIIDENNNIVYSSDRTKLGTKADYIFSKEFPNSDSGSTTTKIDGNNKLVSHVMSNYSKWRYVSIVPINELTSNTGSIIKYTIVVGIISVVLAAVISILLSIAITSPLKKLMVIMKKVENGNLDINFDYPYKDEIGFLGSGFNNMVLNMKDLISRVLDFRLKTKEAELDALQSKINPHFLYNTLQSLQMKAVVDKNEELASMIDLLGRYMRFSISSVKEVIKMKEELEYLDYYISLQKIRFGPKLIFKVEADNNAIECKILKLMLQPIVENAIYHGLEKKQGEWLLTLKASVTDDMLKVQIADNGIGMNDIKLRELKEHIFNDSGSLKSMGLKNINERLKIVFENDYSFDIKSLDGLGTIVEITVPAIFGSELNIYKNS